MKIKTVFKTLLISTIMLNSCITSRKSLSGSDILKDDLHRILYYASLAGSSHNTQPWLVDILSDTLLLVRADFSRKLNIVDPTARGLYISLGAFIENLTIAAESYGYEPKVFLTANTSKDNLVAEISLKPTGIKSGDLQKLEERTTLRTPFMRDTISGHHIQTLLGSDNKSINFLAAHSEKGMYIASKTFDAYTQQANSQDAKEELAAWIRFSNGDVKHNRDGLTTSGMGIKGFAGFMVSRMYSPTDSKKQSFVDTGVSKTKTQVENCGGWLVFTQPSNTPEDWINTGRLYQRTHLQCKDLMIGFHPMNQMIEESDFEGDANKTLDLNKPIHFVARIGYVDQYPDAVSVRRPVSQFVNDVRKHSR